MNEEICPSPDCNRRVSRPSFVTEYIRPLSAVPISTLPGWSAGAMANAVMELEDQTVSIPPSGRIRKTALRAFEVSLWLRPGGCGCWRAVAVSSTGVIVTDVVGFGDSDGCAPVGAGARVVVAASPSAST